MLSKLENSRREGFTIIEVLIVLAIAGLMMLVVFMAVPALQRSGRNTAIKNDAQALAAAFGDFSNLNNGIVPTKYTGDNGAITLQTGSIANGATAKLQGQTAINGSTSGASFAVRTVPGSSDPSAGALYVDSGESCIPGSGKTPTKSTRAFAIYYWTESPGVAAGVDPVTGIVNGENLKGQCLDS